MSALVFLALALVVSVIGTLVLVLRNRKPRSMEAGMDQFSRGLRALAPDDRDEHRGGGSG